MWFTHAVFADAQRIHRQVLERGPELQAGQPGGANGDPDLRALRLDRELMRVVELRGGRNDRFTRTRRQAESSGRSLRNARMNSAGSSPMFSMCCSEPESMWNISPALTVKLENLL
jgi:hypothetical protein